MEVSYDTVHSRLANPPCTEYNDPEPHKAAQTSRSWSELLVQIDTAFNGEPSSLASAVHSKFQFRDKALMLPNNPRPGHPGRHAGPMLDWNPPEFAGAGQKQVIERRFA